MALPPDDPGRQALHGLGRLLAWLNSRQAVWALVILVVVLVAAGVWGFLK